MWGSGEKPVRSRTTPVSPDTEVAIFTGADSGYPTTARRKPDSPWSGRRSSGPGSRPRTPEERLDALMDIRTDLEAELTLLDHQVRRELNGQRNRRTGFTPVESASRVSSVIPPFIGRHPGHEMEMHMRSTPLNVAHGSSVVPPLVTSSPNDEYLVSPVRLVPPNTEHRSSVVPPLVTSSPSEDLGGQMRMTPQNHDHRSSEIPPSGARYQNERSGHARVTPVNEGHWSLAAGSPSQDLGGQMRMTPQHHAHRPSETPPSGARYQNERSGHARVTPVYAGRNSPTIPPFMGIAPGHERHVGLAPPANSGLHSPLSYGNPPVWAPKPQKPQPSRSMDRRNEADLMDRNSYMFSPAYTLGPTSGPRNLNSGPAGLRELAMVKPKRPASYDGKTSCRDYLVQFEMIADLNGWNAPTRALELATSLRGQAQAILSDLSALERSDFDKLVTALIGRFEPENQSEVFRAQLKGRQRKRGEALTELCQEIKRLVRKAYPLAPRAIREALAKDSFIDSLGDAELEWSVYHASPRNINAAVEAAVKFEAFQAGRQRRTLPKQSVRMQKFAPPEAKVTSAKAVTPPQANRSHNNGQKGGRNTWPVKRQATPARRGNCFYCDKAGHYEVNCFQKKRDETARNVGQSDSQVTSQGQTNSSNMVVGATPAAMTKTDKPAENWN